MTTTEYIVICQQVYCSPGTKVEIAYNWDGRRFFTREEAIRHGFKVRGSDDFNIGEVRGNKLSRFYWMERGLSVDLTDIGTACGLAARRDA